MKLGILMDPLHKLKAYKDSSVAMIESAQALGWHCEFFTSVDVFSENGKAYAQTTPIKIKDIHQQNWALLGPVDTKPLAYFDIILMRKDPPFDMEYIYATYALDLAVQEGVLVVNNPQTLRDANEKFFTLHFPQCCPETLVSSDVQRLHQFWETHGNVIYKPLDGNGGESIFQVKEDGHNLAVILETLTHRQTKTIMAQTFIDEITEKGDKRILLLHGKPVEYGLARIPAPGEVRGNLAAGATGKVVPINERDRWICAQLAPTLNAKGLYFVGIDVIGDYLTEINITSPTCIREIAAESNLDVAGELLKGLLRTYEKTQSLR